MAETTIPTVRTGGNVFQGKDSLGQKTTINTKVEVNGVSWPFSSSFTWGYKSGLGAQTVQLPMQPSFSDALVKAVGGGEAILKIIGQDANNVQIPETYRALSVLTRDPIDYIHDGPVLTDDRWRWDRKKIVKTYNLIRKTNDRITFGRLTAALEPTLVEARRYYVPWSIMQDAAGNPLRPWSALDIVVDILETYLGYEGLIRQVRPLGKPTSDTVPYVPPNVILTGESATQVLQRFLGESDNDIYIDNLGKVVIYGSRRQLSETDLKKILDQPGLHTTGGSMFTVDRSAIRPTDIPIMFEVEDEMLLFFEEIAGTGTTSDRVATTQKEATTQLAAKKLVMENVTTLAFDDQVPGLKRGTIVTIREALGGFSVRFGTVPISLDTYRETFGGGHDVAIAKSLEKSGVGAGGKKIFSFDVEALIAWNAIGADYRSLFRVPTIIMQELKDVQPIMADLIFTDSGLRAPSEVFTTISWVVNAIARFNSPRDTGVVLDSFSTSPYTPSPAKVSSIDLDLGLVRIEYLKDLINLNVVNQVIPGRAILDSFYFDGFAEGEVVGDSDIAKGGSFGLRAPWQMAAVVSVTRLTPNSPARLYQVLNSTKPKNMGLENGKGPPVEIFSDYDTARFVLPPTLFNYRNPQANSIGNPEGLSNKQILKAVARQEAQRRWTTYADTAKGNKTFAWGNEAKALRPIGPISQVLTTVNRNGSVRVNMQAAPVSQPINIKNLLSNDVLQAVFRQVAFRTAPQGGRT